MFSNTIKFIKELYPNQEFIPLHAPVISSKEKEFVNRCMESTFVSSVGEYVTLFEDMIKSITGAKYAIATSTGTSALHTSLHLADVDFGDEVLTQSLSFVATANAIKYCGANPIFVDSGKDNLGMCPEELEEFLAKNAFVDDSGQCINKITNRKIKACVPMHVFGHPVEIEKISKICDSYQITLIEDAAEALGTRMNGRHIGLNGKMSIFSFNGNKIVTAGGGGVIVTNDDELGKRAKHITTTAKKPHSYEYDHDELGFNYRLPNLNASLACAQLESLDIFLKNKRETAARYQEFFCREGLSFVVEKQGVESNYWLNALTLDSKEDRDLFLKETNKNGVMTRPIWKLLNSLEMYKDCITTDLSNAKTYEQKIVNIPSGVRL